MISTAISERGEIVIPKKIRDALGLQGEVSLLLRKNAVIIMPKYVDAVAKARERAQRSQVDVRKLTMGDALYEELF